MIIECKRMALQFLGFISAKNSQLLLQQYPLITKFACTFLGGFVDMVFVTYKNIHH